MSAKSVLSTVTGELFQPVRLHYQVFNRKALLDSLQKLRCIKHVAEQGRWVWLYEDEARGLPFQNSYDRLPDTLRPIVIGSFFLRDEGLLLDLRSCERALEAIPFFDKHIPRQAAKVRDAEVVSELFPAEGNERLTPADFFDSPSSECVERFPIHFYEDGIDGFVLALRMRQIVARQHLAGERSYSLGDAIRAVM
jgi:hypothetical protein